MKERKYADACGFSDSGMVKARSHSRGKGAPEPVAKKVDAKSKVPAKEPESGASTGVEPRRREASVPGQERILSGGRKLF